MDFVCLLSESNVIECIKFFLEIESFKFNVELYILVEERLLDSEFIDLFYIVVGEGNDSVFDNIVVIFLKIYFWNVKRCSIDFEIIVVDGLNSFNFINDR